MIDFRFILRISLAATLVVMLQICFARETFGPACPQMFFNDERKREFSKLSELLLQDNTTANRKSILISSNDNGSFPDLNSVVCRVRNAKAENLLNKYNMRFCRITPEHQTVEWIFLRPLNHWKAYIFHNSQTERSQCELSSSTKHQESIMLEGHWTFVSY